MKVQKDREVYKIKERSLLRCACTENYKYLIQSCVIENDVEISKNSIINVFYQKP